MDTTARERNARKHLKKLGYTLRKTPSFHWTRGHFPVGYLIEHGFSTVAGDESDIDGPGTCRDFTMSLTDVEDFLADLAAKEVREDLANVLRAYSGFGGDRFLEVAAAMVRKAA